MTISKVKIHDALEFGFFSLEIDGISIQCCLQERKDGKGYKKVIDIADCGYDWGMCGKINQEAFKTFGKEKSLMILIKEARKSGFKVIL